MLAQEDNLKRIIDNEKAQLEKLKSDNLDNNYDELLQKRAELLQWQTEDKICRQKADQIKAEEEQLLALTPELGQVFGKSQDEVQELRADYNNLPKKEDIPEFSKSIINPVACLGMLLAIFGVASITFLKSSALIYIIIGISVGLYGAYYQFSKNKKEKIIS